MLIQAQLLDAHRRYLLASLYFWLAKKWVTSGAREEAMRVWTVCQEKDLIGNIVYWEGLFYCKMWTFTLTGRLARKYLVIRWPRKLWGRGSTTFRKIPLSPDKELQSQLGRKNLGFKSDDAMDKPDSLAAEEAVELSA
jgi:hypothetical protein